ncbi:hypothetical protein [Paracoccus sulfuroxidans]|nr:hypothetical protein [Paracoccus sulfuroxidans]
MTPLLVVTRAGAQEFTLDQDVVDDREGDWDHDSATWTDSSGQTGQVLPNNGTATAVLQYFTPNNSSDRVVLEVSNSSVLVPGIIRTEGNYTLRPNNNGSSSGTLGDGTIQTAANPLVFQTLDTGSLIVETRVQGNIRIVGSGELRFSNRDRLNLESITVAGSGNFLSEGRNSGTLANSGRTELQRGHDGVVTNRGNMQFRGDLDGLVLESGIATTTGNTSIDAAYLTNAQASTLNIEQGTFSLTGTPGATPRALTNEGTTTIGSNGTVQVRVENRGTLNLNGGYVNGNVINLNSATPNQPGGIANLSGEVRFQLSNESNATLTTNGNLRSTTVINAGTFTVNQGNTLTATGPAGTENTSSGTLNVLNGTVEGLVRNSGIINARGEFANTLENAGALYATGLLTIDRLTTSAGATVAQGSRITVGQGNRLRLNTNLTNTGVTAFDASGNAVQTMTIGGTLEFRNGASQLTNSAFNRLALNNGTILGNVVNNGSMVANGEVSGNLSNNQSFSTQGNLRVGSLTNRGVAEIGVAGAGATGHNLTLTNGSAENMGTMIVNGMVTGAVNNRAGSSVGTLTLAGGRVNGTVTNEGTFSGIGQIDGTLRNSGAGTVSTNGTLNVGAMSNSSTVTVGNTGRISAGTTGSIENTGSGQITVGVAGTAGGGTLAGNVNNRNNGLITVNGGRINGGVTNRNNADIVLNAGTIAGNISNSGNGATLTFNAGSSVERGANGERTLENSNSGVVTVNNSVINADVTNSDNGQLNLNGATIGGNVENNSNGVLNIASNSSITGNLVNNALIDSSATTGSVTLSVLNGTFTNNARVQSSNGAFLYINAATLEFGENSDVDNDNVRLRGNVLNRGTMNYSTDGALENGGLTNAPTGTVTVSANLNGNRYNIANQGTFHVTTDPNSVGVLHNVNMLTNSGSFTIDAGTSVSATQINNVAAPGRNVVMRVGGTVNSANVMNNSATIMMTGGTVNPGIRNAGVLQGTGTLAGLVTNTAAGTVNVGGQLTFNQTLQNNGTVNMTGGRLVGSVVNTRTVQGQGTITGTLENRSSVIAQNGTLTVGTLVNNGTTTAGAGGVLASTNAIQNNRRLEVATGGRVQAAVQNNRGATVAMQGGTAVGAITNAGTVQGYGLAQTINNTNTVTASGGTLRVTNLTNAASGNLRAEAGGTLASVNRLENLGWVTLLGGTVDMDIDNRNNLRGAGTVAGRVDNTGTVTSTGALAIEKLANTGTGTVNVQTGSRLSSEQLLWNSARVNVAGTLAANVQNTGAGRIELESGTISGTVANGATLVGTGTIDGRLFNTGTATIGGSVTNIDNRNALVASGRLEAGTLNNSGTVTVGTGNRLAVTGAFENRQDVVLAGGVIEADLSNRGRLLGTGAITGTLTNRGTLDLDGVMQVGALRNLATLTVGTGNQLNVLGSSVNSGTVQLAGGILNGALVNNGNLRGAGRITGQVTNNQSAQVAANTVLSLDRGMINNRDAVVAGELRGNVDNRAGGTLRMASGTITGNVTNASVLSGTGAITGVVRNSGTIRSQGGLTFGQLINGVDRNEAGAGGIDRAPGETFLGTLVIAEGDTLHSDNPVLNNAGAGLTLNGTLDASLWTAGTAELYGRVTGDVEYAGGALRYNDRTQIDGALMLGSNFTVARGTTLRAAQTIVGANTQLALNGTVQGQLVNQGRVDIQGTQGRVNGQLINNNTINMSGTAQHAGDVLTTAGLAGNGTYVMDVDLRNMESDRIVVRGGAATGFYYFDLNTVSDATSGRVGQYTTLLDVDDSLGSANNYTFDSSGVDLSSERIVFSVDQLEGSGDLAVISQVNPAIGALFGNVALTQSLIGSVINRPTSPFVTGVAYDPAANPCSVGSWGRAMGGHATANGATGNSVSRVNSEISADYYGMQVGTDLACFDNRFGGWNLAFGVVGGVNQGNTYQPVYAVDSTNSQQLTRQLASYNKTDFTQTYAGVYMTANRDAFQADLQYRLENTDFEIKNTAVTGTGLGLSTSDFSSKAQTLSGSLSYAFPLGESGYTVVPTAGFAWSRFSTDSIDFDDGYRIDFEDGDRKVGFVGATIARSFINERDNSALYAYTTGTYYKDFADPMVSIFSREGSADDFPAQRLTSDNLKSYGEISLGMNYVKIIGGKTKPRQLSTGARIDARFGDGLDSIGVSGQFRWQF